MLPQDILCTVGTFLGINDRIGWSLADKHCGEAMGRMLLLSSTHADTVLLRSLDRIGLLHVTERVWERVARRKGLQRRKRLRPTDDPLWKTASLHLGKQACVGCGRHTTRVMLGVVMCSVCSRNKRSKLCYAVPKCEAKRLLKAGGQHPTLVHTLDYKVTSCGAHLIQFKSIMDLMGARDTWAWRHH